MSSDLDLPSAATNYIAQLFYDTTGIALYEGNNPLIRASLNHRLQELGLGSFDEYRAVLRSDNANRELDYLTDSLSSNLTFFFRDKGQLQFMVDECVSRVPDRETLLNLWSVPCSSGEEAYTMAIFLSEHTSTLAGRDWRIHASDLSNVMVGRARRAVYPAESLKNVPVPLQTKYFEPCFTDGCYRVKPAIMSRIQFERSNLFADHNFERPFHIIVCRNLMIYFDWHQQQTLAQHLSRYLASGGYLLLGDLESLTGLAVPFQRVGPRVYQHTGRDRAPCIVQDAAIRVHVGIMNYRLLVIDEREPLLEMISSFLTSLGYLVDTVSSDSEAHRLVRTCTFDLMILDLSFVHQHGVDLFSGFSDGRKSPPVIVLTSMGYDERLLNHLLNKGATMALSKTLPIEHLGHIVSRCLKNAC